MATDAVIVGEPYLALIRAFPLRPIRSEVELRRAIAVMDGLIDRAGGRLAEEEDYMLILADQIEQYETEHYPEPVVPASGMLEFLLEQRRQTIPEVASGSGLEEAVITSILVNERPAKPEELQAIARYFRIDPMVFSELNPRT